MNLTQSLLVIALLFPLVALAIYAVLKPKRKKPQYPAEPEEQPAERVQLKLATDDERFIEMKLGDGKWYEVMSSGIFIGDVVKISGESGEWRCVKVDRAAEELYLEPVK